MRIKTICLNLINDRLLLCRLLLLIGWVLGILLGCLMGQQIPIDGSMMHALMHSRMSIVGGLAVCFLPLLLSAALVWLGRVKFLLPLAFLKAFAFAVISCVILRIFASAGWLIRALFLFSDSVLSFFFLRLWFCCLKENSAGEKDFLYTAVCSLVVFLIDYFIVAPFTTMLF